MLDRNAAVELCWHTVNNYDGDVRNLNVINVQMSALQYIKEYCGSDDTVDSVFSWETIAYTYALLQGLK